MYRILFTPISLHESKAKTSEINIEVDKTFTKTSIKVEKRTSIVFYNFIMSKYSAEIFQINLPAVLSITKLVTQCTGEHSCCKPPKNHHDPLYICQAPSTHPARTPDFPLCMPWIGSKINMKNRKISCSRPH